jgi:AAA family ATP:ADP antiporter
VPASESNSSLITRLTWLSMACAALMIAHQVAAKAARDGLFLSRFPVTDLPKVVGVAALLSIILGLLFSRLLTRYGPARVVPFAVLISGLMHAAEYLLLDSNRDVIVTFTYLHIVGFGAILLSGFWSVANEAFDPREAKLRFGRIAGAGTAGGIFGGLLAERTVYLLNADSLLLLLAIIHFLAFGILMMIRSASPPTTNKEPADPGLMAARAAFARAPFLISLAALVLLGTTSAALLDYLFKSGAAENFAKGPELTRYFAMFYTGAQVLTFLVQSVLTPIALDRLGLGRTVMTLGLALIGGASAALAVPAFGMAASVRALELILRGSFFRSGYELFFTPIPPNDKRAVKTVIDVGCDRFGDALGALALQMLLLLGPVHARVEILIITIGLAATSVWITKRMDRAYVQVLENGLLNRAIELDISDIHDSTTMSAVLATSNKIQTLAELKPAPTSSVPIIPTTHDPILSQLARLRSGDASQVRNAISSIDPREALYAPQLIRLLAWDEVSALAREALLRAGGSVTGQLADVLLDERQDFAVRRRIPRILARCTCQRAFDSLLMAQADPRFEIRFQSARAMDYLCQQNPEVDVSSKEIFLIVARELSVSRPIWEGRRLLDTRDASDSGFTFLDDVLKERANQSLEHVFSLLTIVLPRDPLKIAFRALHSEDRQLLGLGLEYLASTLPDAVYRQLTQLLEATPVRSERSNQEVLDQLMLESGNSLMLELKKKAADALAPDAKQSTANPE